LKKIYNHLEIEKKWQLKWEEDGIFEAKDFNDGKRNYYALTMFPYPSGDLHMGHWYAFAPADAHARFKRMEGYNVMHPQGFDSFGLPAENAAIERNEDPMEWTYENIENFRRQFREMGTSYDWKRELVTSDPNYYKWNQYFFIQFYKNGLAYRKHGQANWCPKCQTTLANEQVKDGSCERCDSAVSKKALPQWFFAITKYADELLNMEEIDWPDKIKIMQKNWIGKSQGVTISFDISEYLFEQKIETFTTRIDTIYGVTFVVLAPEHPLVSQIVQPEYKNEVQMYVKQASMQSEIDRTSTERKKTGVKTGAYCINPLNGDRIPIYIGDYVLSTYGTGAVMGVPAHDQRDFEFAKQYKLEIKVVVSPENWNGEDLEEAWTSNGVQINSDEFDDFPNIDAKQMISNKIEKNGWGYKSITYHLRDWLVSRQRYWGTPIPIIYCDKCGTVPVPESDLPVLLPEKVKFDSDGKSPLTKIQEFLKTTCPKCNLPATRETDTLDTFVCSSWYHLRFASPNPSVEPFNKKEISSWMPVNHYMGGAEHAVMHLLYARFFNKALRDLGFLEFDEPYLKLTNQGMLIKEHKKISKRSNPLTPDPIVKNFGADTLRCYLMFLGPWDQGGDWSDSGINGIRRWLIKIWDLVTRDSNNFPDIVSDIKEKDFIRISNILSKKIINDMQSSKFNTAIASLMEYASELVDIHKSSQISKILWKNSLERLLLHLAPLAPHISEELWEMMDNNYSVHQQDIPVFNDSLIVSDKMKIILQINGKLRDTIEVSAELGEKEIKELAMKSENIIKHIADKEIMKTIYVNNRLLNLVVK
jgi:leucyl-tRNA synthetase